MKRYGFGVDVGGTTCKLGLFERDGTLVEKWEIETDRSQGGKRILPDIAASILKKLYERSLTSVDMFGIGIGVPGAVGAGGVVNRCLNLGWGVVAVERELSTRTGLPVRVANDANLAALGEYWMGSGKGYENIVMVTLGTGVGGGIVIGGEILNGAGGAAGEIGHIIVNPSETQPCSCGNFGCLEQYAAAPGIVRMAKNRLALTGQPSSLRACAPDRLTAREVFDAAREGDELAADVVRETGALLGGAIAIVCNVVNPEVVLLGGGVSRAGMILLDAIRPGFEQGAFHACRDTRILLANLGNDAGIYGGMRLSLNLYE